MSKKSGGRSRKQVLAEQRRRERTEARRCVLARFRPPGSAYATWFTDDAQYAAAADLALGPREFRRRFSALKPLYSGEIPRAAFLLDLALDGECLSVFDAEGDLVPIAKTAFLGSSNSASDIETRSSVHRLHALGALLVDEPSGGLCRVSRPPRQSDEPWVFVGDLNDLDDLDDFDEKAFDGGTLNAPVVDIPMEALDEMSDVELQAAALLACTPPEEIVEIMVRTSEDGLTSEEARDIIASVSRSPRAKQFRVRNGSPRTPVPDATGGLLVTNAGTYEP
ncbi:hypothetical protein [Embleya sp. NBC_00896]|uniref:hypothetical protein n=1 Tax=Embleya sp. NBC_00896 TaxID=2975961 RepID=UPI002F90F6E0|nr:hypothetical protein OG928_48010 [Embleya sp. NBC_00896]